MSEKYYLACSDFQTKKEMCEFVLRRFGHLQSIKEVAEENMTTKDNNGRYFLREEYRCWFIDTKHESFTTNCGVSVKDIYELLLFEIDEGYVRIRPHKLDII